MKPLVLILSLILAISSYGQSTHGLFLDNNPKVTRAEAEWLNANFATENFDFRNKCIGFIEVTSAFYGMGKFTFPMVKKRLPNIILDKIIYKVVVLDSADKVRTKGYDAILVISGRANKGKLKRLKHEAIIYNSKNLYPQIPSDAGLDSNPTLTKANAIFFAELYRMGRPFDTIYDFTGKKLAIFNANDPYARAKRLDISEYINDVKREINETGEHWLGHIYFLNNEQKNASGGYDVIIVHQDKKGEPLSYFIEQLKSE